MKAVKQGNRLIYRYLLKRSKVSQQNCSLEDLKYWGFTENDGETLFLDNVEVKKIIEKYSTPLLIVSSNVLNENIQHTKKAFGIAPEGSEILYSYKTNCVPGILKEIHKEDIGAEVISPYELWLAEKLEVPSEKIIYNGVDKSVKSIESAINLGILSINIDNIEEIEKVNYIAKRLSRTASIGLRIGISDDTQFGLDHKSPEVYEAVKIIKKNKNLKLTCVHFHVTSNAKETSIYKNCSEIALKIIKHIKESFDIEIEYLDIGGGMGVKTTKNMNGIEYGLYRLFGILPKSPEIKSHVHIGKFFADIIDFQKNYCKNYSIKFPKIIIEPGRLITSSAETLITTVKSIKTKNNGKTYAITDAGRLSTTFPCDFEYHKVFVLNKTHEIRNKLYNVMGRVCTSADWTFKNIYLPELKVRRLHYGYGCRRVFHIIFYQFCFS